MCIRDSTLGEPELVTHIHVMKTHEHRRAEDEIFQVVSHTAPRIGVQLLYVDMPHSIDLLLLAQLLPGVYEPVDVLPELLPGGGAALRGQVADGQLPVQQEIDPEEPVSYTHLTLPT